MNLFASPAYDHHEQVVFCHDRDSGLRAIIAIHDTRLGPAIGGCRMWRYVDEDEAVTDALRLSRGMTYKAAMAGLEHGGGKTVVMGDPERDKSEALLLALGRAIDALQGRYYTAEDAGTSAEDMDVIAGTTPFVFGRSQGGSGDPSPMTAEGVVLGMEAAVRHRLGRGDLDGVGVAVQGLGHVGLALAERLAARDARLIVTDIDPRRTEQAARELGAEIVAPEAIFEAEAEVFAPCALGGILDDDTISRLRCSVVAGSANNQLLEDRHGAMLQERGILYAPDYVINAGGLINVVQELHPQGHSRERALAKIREIPQTLREVFVKAEREGRPTSAVADEIARARMERGRAAA